MRCSVRKVCLAAFAVVAGSAAIVWACVSTNYPPDAIVDSINITAAGGTPSDTVSALGTARGRWNTSSCNANHVFTGGTGPPIHARIFPQFYDGSGGFVVMEVTWANFSSKCRSEVANPATQFLCACTDRDGDTSGTIYVNTDEIRGSSCAGLENSLAHELGHVLGLGDSSCGSNYVMNDPGPGPTPSTGECSVSGANWTTASEQAGQEGGGGDPLVLDIDGNGIHTSLAYVDGPVLFDIDGDGEIESTAWLNWYLDDVFLWYDVNGNQVVDGAHEFFGSATVTPWGQSMEAANGFAALGRYDSVEFGGNGDGQLDHRDRVWAHLRTWHDQNADGISQPSEIKKVVALRIVRIDLIHAEVGKIDGSLNTVVAVGRYWIRGIGGGLQERRIADIGFRYEER